MTTENSFMQVKLQKTGSMKWIEPITHHELFKHCNNGRDIISPEKFDKTVRPLLLVHGVKEVRIV